MHTVILDPEYISEYNTGIHQNVSCIVINMNPSTKSIVEFFSGNRFPRAPICRFQSHPNLDFKVLAEQGLIMEKIDRLFLCTSKIVTLEGIEHIFPNLTWLNLGQDTGTINLEPLGNLQYLQEIFFTDNQFITNLHGLEFCRNLRLIDCQYTKIKHVEWLFEILPDVRIHFGGKHEPIPIEEL
jgi:hypothetical protein